MLSTQGLGLDPSGGWAANVLSTGLGVVHIFSRRAALAALADLAGRMTPQRIAQRLKRFRRWSSDAGMTTAEYAVGTVAAVAFAAVLYKVVQSGTVRDALSSIVTSALHISL